MPSWVEMPTGPTAPVRSWIDVTVITLGSFELPELPDVLVLPLDELVVLLPDELQAAATIVMLASTAVADAARLYRDDLFGPVESRFISCHLTCDQTADCLDGLLNFHF
jgi:hypothetical protein